MHSFLIEATGEGFWGTVLARVKAERRVESRGWADWKQRLPNGEHTRFNTASITKLFTALAVCRLVEAGELHLDQPISAVVPDSGIESAGDIRIRHLLSHRAGFPEEAANEGTDSDAWLDAARVPLAFRPGTSWGYSNVGYAVLGAAIERVTGVSYYDIVEELVFSPAGMTATGFDTPAESAPPHARGYIFPDDLGDEPVGDNAADLGRGTPYGYAYSTVGDLERLVDALVLGRLVNPTHARLILRGDVPTNQPGRMAGFGMFNESVGGAPIATLSGAGPGISAWLDSAADHDFLSVVLSNRPKPAAHNAGARLRERLLTA